MMYNIKYTDTGKTNKTITRLTIGAGQELTFSVTDENGTAIDLTSVATNMKIYIGDKVVGSTVTAVTIGSGLIKYPLIAADFAEGDIGTYNVELQFADNATLGSATSIIRTSGCVLTVIDTIAD